MQDETASSVDLSNNVNDGLMEDTIPDDVLKNDADAVRKVRRSLRNIQAHMLQAHLNLGTSRHDLGLVEALYHPSNLNYIVPRRNTAWIPAQEIKKGLDFLRQRERIPRLYLIGGLYPPLFAKSLRDVGLNVEREMALMAYVAGDQLPSSPSRVDGLHTSLVDNQDGIALWWYIWRNARYEVVANGVEPVYIGRDMREMAMGNQQDIILYQDRFPIGVARLTYVDQSANITAVAVLKESRTPESVGMLYHAALQTALNRGCDMVFTSGETEADRQASRRSGFVDVGSLICYSETHMKRTPSSDKAQSDKKQMEQLEFIMQ
jgi:hypothetical protein